MKKVHRGSESAQCQCDIRVAAIDIKDRVRSGRWSLLKQQLLIKVSKRTRVMAEARKICGNYISVRLLALYQTAESCKRPTPGSNIDLDEKAYTTSCQCRTYIAKAGMIHTYSTGLRFPNCVSTMADCQSSETWDGTTPEILRAGSRRQSLCSHSPLDI
jgi:hypothetical protein